MTSGDLEYEFYRNRDQESIVVRGSVVAPAAGGIIATTANLPAGVYEVTAIARYGSVADVIDNMDLRLGGAIIVALPVLPVVNGDAIPFTMTFRSNGAQGISVRAVALGGAGSVFIAHIVVTKIGD